MQNPYDTPPASPRTQDEIKARIEALGIFAPAKPGSTAEVDRERLIEAHVDSATTAPTH